MKILRQVNFSDKNEMWSFLEATAFYQEIVKIFQDKKLYQLFCWFCDNDLDDSIPHLLSGAIPQERGNGFWEVLRLGYEKESGRILYNPKTNEFNLVLGSATYKQPFKSKIITVLGENLKGKYHDAFINSLKEDEDVYSDKDVREINEKLKEYTNLLINLFRSSKVIK